MNTIAVRLRSILNGARSSAFPLIFVVPGSGQIARCAVEGGAHFIVVLNVGLYRISGVSPSGCFLPFGNANDQTENLLMTQIMPRLKDIPVVAGILAQDPVTPLHARLKRFKELGVAGVVNWPALGLIDGKFREALEEEGLTVGTEREMLSEARRAGFATFGFVTSDKDAVMMAESEVDALILNVGWTQETEDLYEKGDRIQYAVVKVNEMIKAVKHAGFNPIYLFFGGSVVSPEDTDEIYRNTEVHGYGGGSAFERIPVNKLITHTIRQFCSIPRRSSAASLGEGSAEIVGATPIMMKLNELIKRIAPYDVNVCIEGESGVGKELIALQIHRLSHRSSMPFITLNCGAIPDTLLESEFFGHEKGAFTGAVTRRLGKFELADRGTLFLDEVAELSPKAQVSLLRVIQQKEITRVGGDKRISVDFRLITATHQDLQALVDQGRFRADLYFRLNTITLKVPPLRARKQDIPALVHKLLSEIAPQFNRQVLGVTPDFMSNLMKHSWPGNVRELKHVLTRAILLEDGPILEGGHFVPDYGFRLHEPERHFSFPSVQPAEERDRVVMRALEVSGGNKSKAARLLGISRKTLYSRLKNNSSREVP